MIQPYTSKTSDHRLVSGGTTAAACQTLRLYALRQVVIRVVVAFVIIVVVVAVGPPADAIFLRQISIAMPCYATPNQIITAVRPPMLPRAGGCTALVGGDDRSRP